MEGNSWQGVLGLAIMAVAFCGILSYPALLYRSVKQTRGAWRLAALLPLIVVIPVLFVTIRGLQQGSNLWPIFLIFLAPVLFVYQAVLLLLHTRIHN
jgi:hypothetical protein